MLGLYGMLNLGARALQAQRAGTEVAGNNIANVNNPNYSRQRLSITASASLSTAIGSQGTGADATAITQIRDYLLDGQIQVQASVTGSLNAQQTALQQAVAALGQKLDQSAITAGSTSGSDATGTQHGIGDALSSLFNEFQSLANDPGSLVQRQILLIKAGDLASKFNQTDSQLAAIQSSLNTALSSDVTQANQLLSDIATLNQKISTASVNGGTPNDLLDARASKMEQLSGLIKIDVSSGDNGALNISVGGESLVTNNQLLDTLSTYDSGNGQLLLRTQNSGVDLTPTGGAMHGIIEARDGAVADLRDRLNTLASSLITQVNTIHSAGFSLTDTTGENFFDGTSAADIKVNATLKDNPALLQASKYAGVTGDNKTALALAQLANAPIASLGNQTLSQTYTQAVAVLGQEASSINTQIDDQKVVVNMLTQQRESQSGVSLDEEMSDMIKYQKAFEASAKIISTVDEMLSTIIQMKQ